MAPIHSNKLVNQVINNLRKGNCHHDFLGKRFIIDNNVHTITLFSGDSNSLVYGTTISKQHGKYRICEWESEAVDNGFINREKVRVVSDYRVVVDLINEEYEHAENTFIQDKHSHRVPWHVWSEPLNHSEDWGELPEGFEPLENPPSEIAIFAEK